MMMLNCVLYNWNLTLYIYGHLQSALFGSHNYFKVQVNFAIHIQPALTERLTSKSVKFIVTQNSFFCTISKMNLTGFGNKSFN